MVADEIGHFNVPQGNCGGDGGCDVWVKQKKRKNEIKKRIDTKEERKQEKEKKMM